VPPAHYVFTERCLIKHWVTSPQAHAHVRSSLWDEGTVLH